MKIKVSVPATSANIGSGFDALGLAVTLYNTVTFEESDHLDISAADGTRIPRGETNLVYRSAKGLFDKVGKTMPPLKLVQTNAIPMARGLGSSSACIIAGLLGANRMLGDVLNTQELLTLATSIEGHPDTWHRPFWVVWPAAFRGRRRLLRQAGRRREPLLRGHRAGLQAADRSGPRGTAQGSVSQGCGV